MIQNTEKNHKITEEYENGIWDFESFYWFLYDIDYYIYGNTHDEWEDDENTGGHSLSIREIEDFCDNVNGLFDEAIALTDDVRAAEYK